MALYKITSGLTTAIDFEDRTVRIPSTSELSDAEAAIASKVADLVQVDAGFNSAQEEIPVVVKDNEFTINKKQEEKINEKLVGDDVEEATPKLNFK